MVSPAPLAKMSPLFAAPPRMNLWRCCCQGALGRKTGVSPRLARIFYIIVLGVASILAIILRLHPTQINFGTLSVACDDAVDRISFVLTVFFAFILLGSLVTESVHRGFWLIKILLVVGGIIGAFFIPNGQFNNVAYGWAARIGSIMFLILQIMVLFDFAYQCNEDWIARTFDGAGDTEVLTNKKWVIGALISAAVLYAMAIAGIAVLYVFYSSCQIGMAFTTVTLLGVALIIILSLFRDRKAILPTAVVVFYSVFLCWSALESNPDATCRPLQPQSELSFALGAAWATITLLWTTISPTQNAKHLIGGENSEKHPNAEALPQETKVEPAATTTSVHPKGGLIYQKDLNQVVQVAPANKESEDDSPIYSSDRPWAFHLIMLCASMYLAMLLTDWGTCGDGLDHLSSRRATMWSMVLAQWDTMFLYTRILVRPDVFTNRLTFLRIVGLTTER